MASNGKLWDTYNKTKDPQLREKLILEYLPLVKLLAGRQAVRFYGHVEMDDLVSYGIFGLIDAIDKFDPNKMVKFETYASLRIKGAIIDSIRQLDWAPRQIRQDNKRLERIFSELEAQLGREPKDSEMAEAMNINIDELRMLIRKSAISTFISLDDYMEQGHEEQNPVKESDEGAPEKELLRKETRAMLEAAIEKLTEKERLVTTLYYFEELTLKEISKIMGVTESRVSQIHSKAVFKLKTRLGKYISSVNL